MPNAIMSFTGDQAEVDDQVEKLRILGFRLSTSSKLSPGEYSVNNFSGGEDSFEGRDRATVTWLPGDLSALRR